MKNGIIKFMKRHIALFFIYFIFLTPVHAEATEYDFEIIIFEDTSGRYANSEQWTHELLQEDRSPDEAQRNLGTKPEKDTLTNITPINGIGLQRFASTLKSNKRYNILVHKSWRQKWLDNESAVDIPIDSRQSGPNTLHGGIRVVLERYLHIYTDMVYRQPRENIGPLLYGEDSQYKEYLIKSHRRMRSKELHYLDHPMVGILVMAMPVEKEERPKERT